MSPLIGIIIAVVLMLPGIGGVLLPGLPGIPYMFLVATVYALVTRFAHLSMSDFWWLGIIAAISVLIDYLAGLLGAKFAGAGKYTVIFGSVGLVAGTFLMPPFGGIILMFVGILLSELWMYGKTQKTAIRSAASGVLGSLSGILLNLVLAIGFIVLFCILVAR